MPVNNPFALNNILSNITQWDGVNLGTPTVWGTAATGQTVIGVNAELFAGTTALAATGTSLNVNVTNTVATTVSGTVSVTQSTTPWIIAGGGTAGTSGTAVLTVQGIAGGTALPISGSVTVTGTPAYNLAQVGGSAISLGQKTASNSVPVTIASDQQSALFAGLVNATAVGFGVGVGGQFLTSLPTLLNTQQSVIMLDAKGQQLIDLNYVAGTALGVPQAFGTAPTGVVVGTSSDLYVSGTRARSNQTTTAAGVQDVNIVGQLGVTNSVTNGHFCALTDNTTKVGVIAGTTALKTDLSSVAGTATTTAASGVQKVGVVGNAGAAFDAALNAAPPANAVQISGIAATALPTATTVTDTVAPMMDKFGRQVVLPQAMRDLVGAGGTTITASTASTSIIASGGAGVFTDIASIDVTNSSATALTVTLSDGTASYIWALAANGGIAKHFSPPLPATSSATAWTLTCGTSVTSIFVVAQWVKNK